MGMFHLVAGAAKRTHHPTTIMSIFFKNLSGFVLKLWARLTYQKQTSVLSSSARARPTTGQQNPLSLSDALNF